MNDRRSSHPRRRARTRRPVRGFVSLELVVGFTLFLGVVLLAINLAVLHYAQGAVRAAAEEGDRKSVV